MDTIKTLKVLGDSSRLRLLRLLVREELSVQELQEILGMAQSRISMQLAQLKQAGLVDVKRSGQKSLYHAAIDAEQSGIVTKIMEAYEKESGESKSDDVGLDIVIARRRDQLRSYFDELAGRFGKSYVPGRSWRALSETLFRILPPMTIADVGAGEGTLALMLAQSAKRVVAVDSSPGMVKYGQQLISDSGLTNVEYRLGDMESLPIQDQEVDLVLMHQALHHAIHPGKALIEAFRALKAGGRIVILDLLKHDFAGAKELYADVWQGFSQSDLYILLEECGFKDIQTALLDKECEAPYFVTILAIATKTLQFQ